MGMRGIVAIGVSICTLAFLPAVSREEPQPAIPASIKKIGEFRVGIKCDSPPFGFLNSQGQPTGIDVDFSRMIAQVAYGNADTAVITCVTSANRIPMLMGGKVDVVIAALAPTEGRRKVVDFANGTNWSGSDVLIRASNNISKLDQLNDQTVFVTKGSLQSIYLSKHYPRIQQVKFDSITDAIQAFREGRGDAVSQDVEPLMLAAERDPDLKLANISFAVEWDAPAVRKGDNDERIFMNAMIALARINGTFATAVGKYTSGALRDVILQGYGSPPPDLQKDIVNLTTSTSFDLAYLRSVTPQLLLGLLNTIWLAVGCVTISVAIGYAGASVLFFNVPIARQLIQFYVGFTRNTPLLVQIFFFFYGLPKIGIQCSATLSGVIVLSMWGGAFNIENIRGGISGIPRGLIEAARALGLRGGRLFFFIVAPVATRTVVPAMMNTAVSITKNTALLQAIGVAELTYVAMDHMATSYHTLEMFVALFIGYVSLVALMSAAGIMIERRLGRGFAQ